MQLFLSQLLNGIGNGAVYASVALALVLIYKATGILNFAQGEMALFSIYMTWKLTDWGVGVVVAIAISVAVSFVAGALIERILIRPVEGAHNPLNVVIVTLGLFLAINSVALLIFGTDPQKIPGVFPSSSFDVAGVSVRKETLGLLAMLAVECGLLWLLLQRTRIGLRLRAVASNTDSSRLSGIDSGVMLMFGWGLAAALGALAGSLAASTDTAFDASYMQIILVYAFAAAALGGFDSLVGAVVGGLIVGIADAMTIEYADEVNLRITRWLKLDTLFFDRIHNFPLVLPLALILVVLLVRPNGLFGSRRVERV